MRKLSHSFRAWGTVAKKMINYFNYKTPYFYYGLFTDNRYFGEGIWIIMQSIGLKDNNCKLVYEGDIISINNGKIKGIIQKHEDLDEYYNRIEIKLIGGNTIICDPKVITESEVIGNIHENPELLEE